MPPKLKRLSGTELVSLLEQFGFRFLKQKGSHIKLRRTNSEGEKETLTIPNHKDIDIGTLHAIFRQSSKYILEEKLRNKFYSE